MEKLHISLSADEITDFVDFLNKNLKAAARSALFTCVDPVKEISKVSVYDVTTQLGLSVYIDGDNSKFWFWRNKALSDGTPIAFTCEFSIAFKEIFSNSLISDSFKTFIAFYLDKI
jgi:hypothetical protein